MVLKYHTGHVNFRGFFLHPMRSGRWRKSTSNREGAGTEIMMVLPVQSLKLVRVFIEANKNCYIFFLFDQTPYKFKKPTGHGLEY